MAVRTEVRGGRRVLVLDIPYQTPTGISRRYRRDAQVQTMPAAKAEHQRLLMQLATTGEIPQRKNSEVTRPDVPTFGDAVKYYRANVALALKPSTAAGYDTLLKGKVLLRLFERPLKDFDESLLTELDATLLERKVSPSTRRNYAVVIRRVLKSAVIAKLLSAMPSLPPLPKLGRKEVRVPTDDEIARVLAASNERHQLVLALALYAGLRAGEVRGLRRSDVDLTSGLLTVREEICRGVPSSPKSGHERIIPIAAGLRPFLVAALASNPGEDDEDAAEALVCRNRTGQGWGDSGIRQALVRAQKRAGVRGWTFHSLRHAFVSALFRRGVGAPTVQRLAGHHSLEVTQRYAHAGEADLRRAVSLLDAPLDRNAAPSASSGNGKETAA